MIIEFKPWPKTPRLFRDIVITEKIDGTNAAVQIVPVEDMDRVTHLTDAGTPKSWELFDGDARQATAVLDDFVVFAQSRKRIITPEYDNFGFAAWVEENAHDLVVALGAGVHFGEWWGHGIQRGYGMDKGQRVFSLFNTHRHADVDDFEVPGLTIVPVLYRGPFQMEAIDIAMGDLVFAGSFAAPFYTKPEGIVVYHEAANQVFKVLLENDDKHKGEVQ